MNRIIILDQEVANKIAAGEVIERPASVVKELVENAIDAMATRIDVEIEATGREFIRVTDNGSGMNREDALLAFERHATSKIKDASDLSDVRTLGFRGEALPSIASVSRMELSTRAEDDPAGTCVVYEGGVRATVRDAGVPVGTSIIVRDLFFNTPARFKYLKKPAVEVGHICDAMERLALAHPDIVFRLLQAEKAVLATTGSGDLLETIANIYGKELAKHLIKVAFGNVRMHVNGYIAGPNHTRPDRRQQFIFVNGRYIRSPLIGSALNRGFDALLKPGRHAIAFLNLKIDPSCVDVNVHPTKAEVRFSNESEVYEVVLTTVRRSLRAEVPRQEIPVPETSSKDVKIAPQGVKPAQETASVQVPGRPVRMDAIRETPSRYQFTSRYNPVSHHHPTKDRSVHPGPAILFQDETLAPGLIGQLGATYILCEDKDGLIIIDQHAAHERVLFERLLREAGQGKVASQGLLVPLSIEANPRLAVEICASLASLRAMGFDIEEFGRNEFIVHAIPALLADKVTEDAIREIITASPDIVEGRDEESALKARKRLASMAACKGAIKAGASLSPDEMQQLVADLFQAGDSHFCPHGRPTILRISIEDLERSFKRR